MRKIKLFGRELKNQTVGVSLNDKEILSMLGIDVDSIEINKLGEITFFVCLKHLSECAGKLPIYHYRNDDIKGKERIRNSKYDKFLNLEPNPYMTASTFWQTVELNRNYWGNAYVYVENTPMGRNAGQINSLWVLPSDQVKIYVDNAGIFKGNDRLWYVWSDPRTGRQYSFSMKEILHYKTSVSWDGITGLAIKDILKLQVETAKYGQSFLQKLYKGNMFGGKIILQYTGELNTAAKDTLITETERYANSVGSGKFLPIPMGITATNLDMKLSDAEFTDLNKLSALQIASAFGIKPNVINNYDKSSYSNSETQQVDFYVNSFMPTIKGYKEENTRKLLNADGKEILEHDIEELFKMDPVRNMEYCIKGANNGILTSNDCREKLGYAYSENANANELMVNGNIIPLSMAGTQYQKKGGNS